MAPRHYPLLIFAFEREWRDLRPRHPSVVHTFLFIVLPFSLFPPAMLCYAGAHHPTAYFLTANPDSWRVVAGLFLLAELLSVPLMGGVIRSMAGLQQREVSFADAFLLAAMTAVPLWLTSLSLLVPHAAAPVTAGAWGLWAAVKRLHHGADTLLRSNDPLDALNLTHTVFAVGLLVWALLVGTAVVALMT